MEYRKCPKCEMNYIRDDEEICGVCAQPPEKVRRAKKPQTATRKNIAFKCTYCDGGLAENGIGFAGVCSDAVIEKNIGGGRVACGNEGCDCRKVLDGKMSRAALDARYAAGEAEICQESRLLSDWWISAGFVLRGKNKGQANRLLGVQTDSLCVLTSREPGEDTSARYVFGVFLVQRFEEGVNDTAEGQGRYKNAGNVSAHPKYRLRLTRDEARKILFWNYCSNEGHASFSMHWGTGLFRYLSDTASAQILRDVARVKSGTPDEALANEMLRYFCGVNQIDIDKISAPSGALKRETDKKGAKNV